MKGAVAALFVAHDSIYREIPRVECYDAARDARTFPGGIPVVAHPPCRLWSLMRVKATRAPAEERDLAWFALDAVRRNGGVLEHPAFSSFWTAAGLDNRGGRDAHGWTLPCTQHWWGHLARKATCLYIVGVEPRDIPEIPLSLAQPTYVMAGTGKTGLGREIPKRLREATPRQFAEWLVELARRAARH